MNDAQTDRIVRALRSLGTGDGTGPGGLEYLAMAIKATDSSADIADALREGLHDIADAIRESGTSTPE